VECIVRTGAGALNVDASRIATDTPRVSGLKADGSRSQKVGHEGWDRPWKNDERAARIVGDGGTETTQGRWPANFYTDSSGAAALDAMSGEREGTYRPTGCKSTGKPSGGVYEGGLVASSNSVGYNDTGGASRFFFNAVADQIDDADAVGYYAKASRKERDAGLNAMPANIGHAAYGEFAGTDEHPTNGNGKQRNPHPTIKPISLTRWLATLLLPPAIYAPRRLFVPFAGAGSEAIGASLAGWDEVVGVEMMNDEEHPYVDIARSRLAHWLAQPALIGGAS
jgi:hypothetical protein